MNPAISVIYVNYNTSVLLIHSIISLQEKSRSVSFEIIVVDNNSTEDEKELLAAWIDENKDYPVKVIWSSENLGFGKANNYGARQASGKYLFFLNPDTLICNDALSIFYHFMEDAGPQAVACGGNLLKPDGGKNHSYGNFPGILLELCTVGLGLRLLFNRYYQYHVAIGSEVEDLEIRKVPYIVGADVFIKAAKFNLINGFDENYFMYYEETDLFLRLSKHNLDSYLIPTAEIIHFEGAAINRDRNLGFNYKKFELLLCSQLYYYKKWLPAYKFAIIKGLIFTQILVQFAKGKMGDDFKRLKSIFKKCMVKAPDKELSHVDVLLN